MKTTRNVLLGVCFVLTAIPASAQVDLSGEWTPVRKEDNIANTELGDWVGIPLNDAGRARASAWDASIQSLPEWQCRPHGTAYINRGPSQLRISKEVDPVSRETIAWHLEWLRSVDRPIYMDGRPHPSRLAQHTWAGFSTGEWIGDVLRVRTTHLKEEYLKRNGVFHSDQVEVTSYLIRRGNYLTYITIAYDPVYLTEPLIRSNEYQLALNQQIPPYPCTIVQEIDRPRDYVPHYLPGTNPWITDFASEYKIPMDVILSGAASMYPETRARIAAGTPPPRPTMPPPAAGASAPASPTQGQPAGNR